MRKAIIEIGTNSIKCLIAEFQQNAYQVVDERVIISRLGEGMMQTNLISPLSFRRNLDATRDLRDYCKEQGVQEIITVGTMALRSADNAAEYIRSVQRELRLDIQVLSGIREAYLSRLGALSTLKNTPQNVLIIDTGGGSTEIIHSQQDEILHNISISLGAHQLKHLFGNTDPMVEDEYHALCNYVDQQFSSHLRDYHKPWILGIGGTPVSLAAVELGLVDYDAAILDGKQISATALNNQIGMYRSYSDLERKKIPGLPPQRSDLILYGAVIVRSILKHCGVDTFSVSVRGLRHGILEEMLISKS